LGTQFVKKVHKRIVLKTKKFMGEHNPDYVVSCVHHFNDAIADALHAINIPFGIIPTELMDLEHSPLWFSPIACQNASFFALALEEMVQQGMRLGCKNNCINTGGLVIKRRFYEKIFTQISREEMAYQLGLSTDMFTILVTMGGAGNRAIFDIIKLLNKADRPLQIIACCGKDKAVKRKLEICAFQSRNRLHILGFTNNMENYMKASNLVLTKPGPTTIWEALVAKVPLLLDTKDVIIWEKSQVDFVLRNGFGCAVSDHALFLPTIQQLRENNCSLLANISARMRAFPVSDATVSIINQIRKTFK
jgi:processive 1,2-diacylglycerol beta-glucosyltransferase